MEDLGEAQLSHRALSLSYRPETGRNVRVSAVSSSSSRTVELVPKNGGGGRDAALDGEGCRGRVARSRQWSSANVLDRPRGAGCGDSDTEKDGWTVGGARPVERAALAAERGWQNAVGMLEGRSKSFVLPDRCLRRSDSPIADNKSSALVPRAAATTAAAATTDAWEQHRHHRQHHHHHHYYQHHHHHHHHQRVSPTSSSSTSSSISSTNHVTLSSSSPSSATTPSLHNIQPRVRACERTEIRVGSIYNSRDARDLCTRVR